MVNIKMLKNISRGILLILVLFLFLFSGQKYVVKGETCNVNAQNCPKDPYCGKCSGTCFWETSKWTCLETDHSFCWTKTCLADYEGWSADCFCDDIGVGTQCYWDSGCIRTNCGTPACTDWSDWSPCNNCYTWRYCQTPGNDSQENKYCCSNPSPGGTATPLPGTPPPSSCTVTLPADFSLALGNTRTMDATITNIFGTVTQVNFSSSNTSVASVSPASDTTADPYRTVVTGNSSAGNSAVLKAQVVMSGAVRCEAPDPGGTATPGPVFFKSHSKRPMASNRYCS